MYKQFPLSPPGTPPPQSVFQSKDGEWHGELSVSNALFPGEVPQLSIFKRGEGASQDTRKYGSPRTQTVWVSNSEIREAWEKAASKPGAGFPVKTLPTATEPEQIAWVIQHNFMELCNAPTGIDWSPHNDPDGQKAATKLEGQRRAMLFLQELDIIVKARAPQQTPTPVALTLNTLQQNSEQLMDVVMTIDGTPRQAVTKLQETSKDFIDALLDLAGIDVESGQLADSTENIESFDVNVYANKQAVFVVTYPRNEDDGSEDDSGMITIIRQEVLPQGDLKVRMREYSKKPTLRSAYYQIVTAGGDEQSTTWVNLRGGDKSLSSDGCDAQIWLDVLVELEAGQLWLTNLDLKKSVEPATNVLKHKVLIGGAFEAKWGVGLNTWSGWKNLSGSIFGFGWVRKTFDPTRVKCDLPGILAQTKKPHGLVRTGGQMTDDFSNPRRFGVADKAGAAGGVAEGSLKNLMGEFFVYNFMMSYKAGDPRPNGETITILDTDGPFDEGKQVTKFYVEYLPIPGICHGSESATRRVGSVSKVSIN